MSGDEYQADGEVSDGFAGLLASFKAVELFPLTGEMRLTTTTGEVLSEMGAPVPDTVIVRSRWIPPGTVVELEFDGGDTVELDISARSEAPDPRRVVYLDQNHWVELARARVGSTALTGDRLATYQQFTELAKSGAIIVPLSAAHLTELGRKSGQQRRDVAVTMLELSRGWQMRNPLQIRNCELQAAFEEAAAVPPVFTLDPDVLWTREPPSRPPVPAGDVHAEAMALADDLSAACALADVLAEPERIESEEGAELADRWATSFSELAQHVRTNPKAKERLRMVSLARFITDMRDDVARAGLNSGMSPEQFQQWLVDDAEDAFIRMPALGRLREVTHRRLANADDTWVRNDLYDMLFLGTAAAYADFVVGERKIGNYLRQVDPNVTAGAEVFVKMADALEAIRARLDSDSGSDAEA